MPFADPIPQTSSDRPVVLLPVRLETRFVKQAAATELWIRVYPVALHADTHEAGLTPDEAAAGDDFWTRRLATGSVEADWQRAWARLAARFGARRAAWIARLRNPNNGDDAARRDVPRTGSWTRGAHTTVLPDRWVARGYKIDKATATQPRTLRPIFEAWGSPVRAPLRVGPSPAFASQGAADALQLEPELQWIVDFEAARTAGMALKVPLAAADVGGFDRLVVLGVKETIGGAPAPSADELATASAALLEELFDAHHYTDGLAFVPPGTPTNNTTEAPSGFTSADPGFLDSYRVEVSDAAAVANPEAPQGTPGAAAARALGISSKRLARLAHSGRNAADVAPRDADVLRMHAALWPATWGYYLEQMMAGAMKDPPPARVMRDVRCRYLRWARAGGPLPTLRVGTEPYGLLPATSIDRWEREDGDAEHADPETDAHVARFLRRLRDAFWLPSLDKVPRVGAGDPHAALVRILGMEGRSSSFAARSVVGSQYVDYLFGFLNEGTSAGLAAPMDATWWQRMGTLTQYVRSTKLAIPSDPRLTEALYADFHFPLRSALVRPTPPDAPLEPAQYIASLLGNDVAWIRDVASPGTLLHALLRHAALLAYTTAARALAGERAAGWLEPELIGFPFGDAAAETRKPWDFLAMERVPGTPAPTIGAVLEAEKTARKGGRDEVQCSSSDPLRAFGEFWQSLDHLRQLPPSTLEHTLEHTLLDALDLSAHRLDAWLTSFATQRLWRRRETVRPDGVFIGGYGLLVDVRPRGAAPASCGFVHAPSVPHAATAAILRSGFLSRAADAPFSPPTPGLPSRITCITKRNRRSFHERIAAVGGINADGTRFQLLLEEAIAWKKRGVEFYVERPAGDRVSVVIAHSARGFEYLRTVHDADAPNNLLELDECAPGPKGSAFAVDLSSDRVRRALRVLDGVRQGQPLGALLGYRFERGLHEAGRDELIVPFRNLAPLVADKWTIGGELAESVPAHNVVDGLALGRRSRSRLGIPWGEDGLPPLNPDDAVYIDAVTQLHRLDDTLDALGDLLLAESVYHIARGNPLRSGTTLDAIGRGEAPPPELEVVRTPRSGVGVTHRVVTLFAGEAAMPKEWKETAGRPRARAEPHLAAWAAWLIGDPLRVTCRGTFVDAAGTPIAGLDSQRVKLADLGLSPLDVVYMAEAEQGAQGGELEQRVVHHLMRAAPATLPPDAGVALDFSREGHPNVQWVGFDELREAARAARKLFTGARSLDGSDLAPAGSAAAAPPTYDLVDLARRADEAVGALRAARDALAPLATTTDPARLETLRALLLDLAGFGVPGAVPLSARGSSSADLLLLTRQARSVLAEATRRLDGASAIATLGAPVTSVARDATGEGSAARRVAAARDSVRQSDVAELEALERRLARSANGAGVAAAATDPRAQVDLQLARLREVFGADFRVLPRLRPANAAALGAALRASDSLQNGDPLAAVTWLQRVSRVRDGVGRLDAVLSYAGALSGDETTALRVAQLPYEPGDRWAALAPAPQTRVPAGRTGIVVHGARELDTAAWLAGLHVDEFTESVPNASETTAVAFHFDRPSARAPQSILLAVSPYAGTRPWDLATLDAIVNETLDLACARAVDADGLESIGHFLPALFFGVNLARDTVSTDFQTLAARRT